MMLVLYGIFPNNYNGDDVVGLKLNLTHFRSFDHLIFTQKRKYIYVHGGTYFYMLMINLVG